MQRIVPWWFRILVKILLSRLPLTYRFWKRLKLFEHGDMHLPERAFDTLFLHAKSAGVLDCTIGGRKFSKINEGDFNVLELGPGDSLYSGLISFSLGASHTWLVDTGRFAATDLQSYIRMRDYLVSMGYYLGYIDAVNSFDEYLSITKTSYLTEGVKSLSHIPDASIDFCFSNAVLEHINADDFDLLISELKRILKPTSISCHRVDLKDHLGGGLNNLRFSRRVWEGSLFKSSGFYTNRIRYSSYVTMFSSSGFCVETPRIERWNEIPTARRSLDAEFKNIPSDDLLVSGFDMVLKLNKNN
jgi:hypothetical protein